MQLKTESDQNKNQIRLKIGLQIQRIRICEKASESDRFEIRHIPKRNYLGQQVSVVKCVKEQSKIFLYL